jgi:lipoprotein-releasing system ATP-binding protein
VAEPLLVAEGLRKSFRTPRREIGVLADCSLELTAGQALSILGASGSGKSTLLHILGTLDLPDAGRIRFRGEDLVGASSRRLSEFRRGELGFIFQFHHLLPEFSAEENVALPALIARWPRKRAFARAGEMLERIGLGERREHRPGELSGGEQQRVAVARALIGGPSLVLADEPTGNLDDETGTEVAEQLFRLCREEGMGLVLVTHDRELADRAGSRFLLESGALRPI